LTGQTEEGKDLGDDRGRLVAEILKANPQVLCAQDGLPVARSQEVETTPEGERAQRLARPSLCCIQQPTAVFPQLVLIGRVRHIPAITDDVEKFQLGKLAVKEGQEEDTARLFPPPGARRWGQWRQMLLQGPLQVVDHGSPTGR